MVESVGVARRRRLGRPPFGYRSGQAFSEKREKWRTPSYSGSVLENKSAFYFAR